MSTGAEFDHQSVDHLIMVDSGYTPLQDGDYSPEEMRSGLFQWYMRSGFRGCLFNKVASQRAMQGEFRWDTPVELASIDDITSTVAGPRVLETFDELIEDDPPELVSYIFPNIQGASSMLDLLTYLCLERSDRFKLFPVADRAQSGLESDDREYVGVQFRIKIGENPSGADVHSYPMIYNPEPYTTFARRFGYFAITFNPRTAKNNPETPDTFIGVDDINLGLPQPQFERLFKRSVDVNMSAHSDTGQQAAGLQFSRRLFRAHNALVVPVSAWEDSDLQYLVVDELTEQSKVPVNSESPTIAKTPACPVISEVEVSKPLGTSLQVPVKTNRRRGHPMKQVKEHLAQNGKLNAKSAMPKEQKRARRRKR